MEHLAGTVLTSNKDVFTRTSIHGYGDRIKTTYCVVHVDGNEEDYKKFESEGTHAEEELISYFKDPLNAGENLFKRFKDRGNGDGSIKLIAYLSRAPCGRPKSGEPGEPPRDPKARDCARELVKFCEDHNVKMDIKAVGPHWRNEQELKALMETDGVTLAAFTEEDFATLQRILREASWGVYTGEIQSRDENTQKYFDQCMI